MEKSGLLQTTTTAFFGFSGIAGFIAATFAGLFVGTFALGWLSSGPAPMAFGWKN